MFGLDGALVCSAMLLASLTGSTEMVGVPRRDDAATALCQAGGAVSDARTLLDEAISGSDPSVLAGAMQGLVAAWREASRVAAEEFGALDVVADFYASLDSLFADHRYVIGAAMSDLRWADAEQRYNELGVPDLEASLADHWVLECASGPSDGMGFCTTATVFVSARAGLATVLQTDASDPDNLWGPYNEALAAVRSMAESAPTELSGSLDELVAADETLGDIIGEHRVAEGSVMSRADVVELLTDRELVAATDAVNSYLTDVCVIETS